MMLTIPHSDIERVASFRRLLIFNVLNIVAKGGDEYAFWFGVTSSATFGQAIEERMTRPQPGIEGAGRSAR